MDKYTRIKNAIERLNVNKSVVAYLEEELKLLESERMLKGVSYDGVKGGGGISDTVADTAIRISEKEQEILIQIARKKNEIKFIEGCLKQLKDDEREVIIGLYVKYKPYWKISEDLGCSISNCKKIRKQGFDRLMKLVDFID